MKTAVFIHGLNTYGDNDIHLGPLKFGSMHGRVESALRKRGIDFLPIDGFTPEPIEQLAERVAQSLSQKLNDSKLNSFTLLGHSTGGLVARALAARPEFEDKINFIVTWGTPHHGTLAANFGLNFEKDSPLLAKVFAHFGYDTQSKKNFFAQFTPDALSNFNSQHPKRPNEISLICECPQAELSLPLKAFYSRLHPTGEASDGFIWSKTQIWGETVGPFRLDHFGELGFFPHLTRARRRAGESEFERLIACISTYVSK